MVFLSFSVSDWFLYDPFRGSKLYFEKSGVPVFTKEHFQEAQLTEKSLLLAPDNQKWNERPSNFSYDNLKDLKVKPIEGL